MMRTMSRQELDSLSLRLSLNNVTCKWELKGERIQLFIRLAKNQSSHLHLESYCASNSSLLHHNFLIVASQPTERVLIFFDRMYDLTK